MARAAVGAAVLAVVARRVGTGPFVAGVLSLTPAALLTAVAVGAVVTLCCSWRWCAIATALGAPLGFRAAVAAYYRSQFLNSTLPWGVLGDVHRAVRHGRDAGAPGPAARAVVWDRLAGQVVQLAITVPVLGLAAPALRGALRPVLPLAAVALLVAVPVLLGLGRPGRAAWPPALVGSVVTTAGHVLVLVVAARSAGVTASPATLVPLGLIVLLAMSVPLNVAGWGPREGAAAWAFGLAGLGAGHGVAVATAYGVLALAASLPGVVVLLASRPRRSAAADPVRPAPVRRPGEVVPHG